MLSIPRIGVLITSHNRRDKTLECLASLYSQTGVDVEFLLSVVLVDAGSSDGTGEVVSLTFPSVRVERVPDTVYWGHGMRIAASSLGEDACDFYLWLNDDVVLDPRAMQLLLRCSGASGDAIAVGQLRDTDGMPSYGGFTRGSRPLQFVPVGPQSCPVHCETFNGNVVLIPTKVARRVGSISAAFPHAMGDIDFGLRAHKAGYTILQAEGYLGVCNKNPLTGVSRRPRPLERLGEVTSTKRLPPAAWWTMCRRHAGLWAPVIFLKPYVSALAGNGK